MSKTRTNEPEFQYKAQTKLWRARREHAMLTGFRFKEALEEKGIRTLSSVEAAEAAADTLEALDACKASRTKNGKKSTGRPSLEPEHASIQKPARSPKPTASSSSSESSLSSSDDDANVSRADKRHRGRRHRKLFKMHPPAKYTGRTDAERTYEAVQQFLTEVSRYLRLATHVDMEDDISEYVAAFLDGFAYNWFETLDKGKRSEKFLWEHFESAVRKKFISRNYIQQAITRYHAIKQNGRSVAEYIVEREGLESTLGKALTKAVKESSFKEGLNRWIRDVLVVFSDLPFEQYKKKAEAVDEEARELRAAGLSSLSTSDPHSILDIDDGYGSGSQTEDGASGGDDDEELDDSEVEKSEESAGSDDDNGSEEEPEEEELDEEAFGDEVASGYETSEVSGDAESDADAHVAAAVMDAVHHGWRR